MHIRWQLKWLLVYVFIGLIDGFTLACIILT